MKKAITLIIIFLLNISIINAELLKLHFIDVGEGDSIIIQTPNKKNILIDCGNVSSGIKIYKYLKSQDIEKIDYLIITHPHPDHFSGVFSLLDLVDIGKIYDNGENIDNLIKNSDFYRWYNEFYRSDKRYRVLSIGDKIKFGKVKFEVLWPETFGGDMNTNSLVLNLDYNDFSCILMGDANIETEQHLLKAGVLKKCNILKAGHHAAIDTCSDGFLEKVDPDIVVISVNKDNIRGYPDSEVVSKYEKRARVYYTYDGDVVVEVDKKSNIAIIR